MRSITFFVRSAVLVFRCDAHRSRSCCFFFLSLCSVDPLLNETCDDGAAMPTDSCSNCSSVVYEMLPFCGDGIQASCAVLFFFLVEHVPFLAAHQSTSHILLVYHFPPTCRILERSVTKVMPCPLRRATTARFRARLRRSCPARHLPACRVQLHQHHPLPLLQASPVGSLPACQCPSVVMDLSIPARNAMKEKPCPVRRVVRDANDHTAVITSPILCMERRVMKEQTCPQPRVASIVGSLSAVMESWIKTNSAMMETPCPLRRATTALWSLGAVTTFSIPGKNAMKEQPCQPTLAMLTAKSHGAETACE